MRRDLLYVDSNVFIYPVIYDEEAVVEAGKFRDFLLKIALGKSGGVYITPHLG